MNDGVLELYVERFLKEKGYEIVEYPKVVQKSERCGTYFIQAKVKPRVIDPWPREDYFSKGLYCLEKGIKEIADRQYYVHIDFKRVDAKTAYIIAEIVDNAYFQDEEAQTDCFFLWY